MDNTHRALRRLVVVDAWFRRAANRSDRYTLYANVSFNEERIGGDSSSTIVFRVSVKQCEVVFIPPKPDFMVDRESVKRQRPLTQQEINTTKQRAASRGWKGTLSIARNPAASVSANAQASDLQEQTVKSRNMKSMYNEQYTRSLEGHDAWRVDGKELPNGRLNGPVFDIETEPRLTLVDMRSEACRSLDDARSMTPLSRVVIRCLRDDIDIYDIRLKDEAKQGWLEKQRGHRERLAVARGVLREALLEEGLSVGSLLDDPFAEMTICDATVPILDQGLEGR